MKLSVTHRNRGIAFTLVELLVVIAIIAILAGVVVAGVGSVLRTAKRTKANSTAVQIQTAIQSYYTEYSVYPIQTADPAGDAYYNGAANADVARWQNLTWALCGNINPLTPGPPVTPTVPNARSIAYLTPTRGDMDANGILQNPFGSSGTSSYFYMAIDTDYSGVTGDSGTAANKIPNLTVYPTNYTGTYLPNGTPGGVAVWCPCDQQIAGGTAAHPSPANFWAHTY